MNVVWVHDDWLPARTSASAKKVSTPTGRVKSGVTLIISQVVPTALVDPKNIPMGVVIDGSMISTKTIVLASVPPLSVVGKAFVND